MSTSRARFRAPTAGTVRELLLLALSLLVALVGVAAFVPAPASATSSQPLFVCTGNTVYSVDQNSRTISKLDSVTGTSSGNGKFEGNNDAVNALALPASGGRYIYAINRSDDKVLRFDATTQDTDDWSTGHDAEDVIAGAINPANGIYYYASGGSSWTVYAFNTATNTVIGKVATISGSDLSINGDMAFDASGNLYIVSNSSSFAAGALVRVNGSLPTTAGNATRTVTKLASTPANSGQYAAMAFDPGGALVIGTGNGVLLRVNPSSGATISSKTVSLSLSDLTSCAVPSTATVRVNLPDGRVAPTDQFATSITGGGISSGNTGTTTGTETGVQDQSDGEYAGPVVVLPGTTYTITQTAAGGASLDNYTTTWKCVNPATGATVASGSGSSGSFTAPSTAGTTVVCTFTNIPKLPAIELDKTGSAVTDVDGNGHDAGDTITYSFKVTNTGNLPLNPVTVTDTKVGTVTCPAGSLAPGASVTCTPKTYTLNQADVNAGKVDNTATAEGTTPGGQKVTDPDSVSTPVTRSPAVEIDKTAGAVNDLDSNGHDVGDTITYTFKVTNTGNVTLNPVTVADPKLGGAISCPTGGLAPGASFNCTATTYTLTQADVNAGKVDNTATVTGTPPSGGSVTDSDSTSTPLNGSPGIELDKTAGAIIDKDGNGPDAGDEITYGFKVTNTGTVTLNPVTVSDPKIGPVTCPSGPLLPGASVTCTPKTYVITQADVEAGKVANTATATGRTPGGQDVTAADSTTTTVAATARIELDKTASSLVDKDGNGPDTGDEITYGFKVTNTGAVTLDPVTVTDPMFASITCPSGPLAPGAAVTCTPKTYVVTQADVDRGKVDNVATAHGKPATGDVVEDTDGTTTPLAGHPSLRLDKVAGALNDLNGNGPDVGDTITFSFTVTNTGNQTLTALGITDPKLGLVTCPSGSLAPGVSVACSDRVYALTAADLAAGVVTNTATATATTPGGGTVQDDDSTSTPVEPRTTNVKVTKTVSDDNPDAGDEVTYTLKAKNTSTQPAADVVLEDVLPSGVTFVSADAPCVESAGSVTCALGTLAPGAEVTVRIKVTVDPLPAQGSDVQHLIDVQKAEIQVDLEPGETRTASVTCPTGYVATDGSARIDHVDQDTGTLASVRVTESRATATDTWTATLVNEATGRALTKVFTVCVAESTQVVDGHAHDLVWGAPVATTSAIDDGRTDVDLACPAGFRPVRPGYQLDGTAAMVGSAPVEPRGWRFTVDRQPGDTATSGSFELGCLGEKVAESAGHQHTLELSRMHQTLVVPAGEVAEVTLTCASDAKGIVGGYDVDGGLVVLGNDPRPISRVFRFHNPTSGPLEARVWLDCLAVRTGGGGDGRTVVNTATVTTSTAETTQSDNSASASFTVRSSGAAAPTAPVVRVAGKTARVTVRCSATSAICVGTAVVRAVRTQRIHGTQVRKGAVLATTRYRIASGERTVLRMHATKLGRKALRSDQLRKARLAVGSTQRVVKVRR